MKEKILKTIKKEHLVLILLTGILLLVIAIPTEEKKEESSLIDEHQEISQKVEKESKEEYRVLLEQQLQEILETMEGVGKAKVMITFEDEGETFLEKEITRKEEHTKENRQEQLQTENEMVDYQEETVYVKDEKNQEIPFVRKKVTPQVQGVFIVAQGGNNAIVKNNISDAVLALFPIEAHKIKVVKMNE